MRRTLLMSINSYDCGSLIPNKSGVGLKPDHYSHIIDTQPSIGWFEVHPENYMGDGGPPHHYLRTIRNDYPLSLHGVGLSIGGAKELDQDHLNRLKTLVELYDPGQFSEHLAWSTHDEGFLNDLLPLPYTEETLKTVCEHIDQVQNHIGRTMLLENPATYVVFEENDYEEIDFLQEIVKRTGCGLLLDVNNVYVSCTNHKRNPKAYIQNFPVNHVREIHLAGHAEDVDDAGDRLLIDAHDRQVIDEVWDLYKDVLSKGGAIPTLIEWDTDIPEWDVLFAEAKLADDLLTQQAALSSEDKVMEVA